MTRPAKDAASSKPSKEIPANEHLLTVEEVMKLLQVSKAQLYRLMGQKRIKSTLLGRSRRFKASTIDAFIHAMPEAMPPKGKRR